MFICCSDHECKDNKNTGVYFGIYEHPCMGNKHDYSGVDRNNVGSCNRKEKQND